MFLTQHALTHFLYEGIRLRHLCDWTCFVNAERGNVDWNEFNERCAQVGAARFVAALNAVCIRRLGMCIDGTALRADEKYADRVLVNTLDISQHASHISDPWRQRMAKVGNMFSHSWKFNEVYDRGLMRSVLGLGLGFVFDRHPAI
ncbi:MAG: nucleotidyltransferase family protein [Ruminococcus flavefaciens]|nr:nucleotidyltransferase family protein [Ruminococcus flavefaciens]